MTQTTPTPSSDGNPAQRFFGALFMAVGGLIAGLSGLCTAAVIAVSFASGSKLSDILDGIWIILVFGGPPIAAGLAIFFVGRAIYRAGKPKPDPRTFD